MQIQVTGIVQCATAVDAEIAASLQVDLSIVGQCAIGKYAAARCQVDRAIIGHSGTIDIQCICRGAYCAVVGKGRWRYREVLRCGSNHRIGNNVAVIEQHCI